jgi:hypothetical protein
MNDWVHTNTKPQISSTRSRGLGWRIHGSVEDTKLSTNKQHSLSHDGGVGQDPLAPCKQKRLVFKFASAAWVDATHDVDGVAESKWKEMQTSEQRAMPGEDTRAGAAAAARSRVLATPRVPRMPLYLRGLLF